MKKTFLTIAIVLGLYLCSFAQGGLFGYGEVEENEDYSTAWYIVNQNQDYEDNSLFSKLQKSLFPGLPNHGESTNQNAPLGSGAALLIGFGAAYALKKRKKD